MDKKIYVLGEAYSYANWLEGDIVDDIESANIFMGIGGSDVSPKYYNESSDTLCFSDPIWDAYEFSMYKRAIELGLPIVATCKAAQWCCILAGGKLVQHLKHPHQHFIHTYDGQKLLANSLHHQSQDVRNLIENVDYKILAYSDYTSPYHFEREGKNIKIDKDPEIVYYPKLGDNGSKSLSLQMHIEMLYPQRKYNPKFAQTVNWVQKLLNKFLNNEL